jgi:AraC-like DNA-binding protein
MAGPARTVDGALGIPAPRLRPLIARYTGYRYLGFPAGMHLGLPSRYLTVVLALGPPTRLTGMPDPRQPPGEFRALASGLALRPAVIGHDGDQFGVQLDLTPAGARALLGLPAGELGAGVVELETLLGPAATELLDRMSEAVDWPGRFAVLDALLQRRLDGSAVIEAPLAAAWDAVTRSGGRIRVENVATTVGWSRRHLTERFTREFGLGPKELGRAVRFEHSKRRLQAGQFGSLADVAAACGYYDQAHLAREWGQLAGCAPSRWLAGEELPSIQDAAAGREHAQLP